MALLDFLVVWYNAISSSQLNQKPHVVEAAHASLATPWRLTAPPEFTHNRLAS